MAAFRVLPRGLGLGCVHEPNKCAIRLTVEPIGAGSPNFARFLGSDYFGQATLPRWNGAAGLMELWRRAMGGPLSRLRGRGLLILFVLLPTSQSQSTPPQPSPAPLAQGRGVIAAAFS